ncbi:hypothetical protein FOZ60_002199 [Perkinsus olseni]|uniref:Uncharacterized protein n=1 Tax=Perkinsus olseni TaxID=32597 RepID=A0A7J6NZJ9_PEROL|nr:hypothetical protein FOZ60_002199 [Perkinsus olseni]
MVSSTVPRIVQGKKGATDSVAEEAGLATDAQRVIRSPLNAYPPPSTGWPASVKSKLALMTGGASVGGVRKDHIASVKESIKEKAARDGATEVTTVNPAPKQGTHSVEVTPSKTISDSATPYGSHRVDHTTTKAGPYEQNSEGGLYREMEDTYPQPSSADDAANRQKSSRRGDEEPYPGDNQTGGELSLKGADEGQHIVYVSIPVEDLRSAFGDEAALCRDFSNSSAIRCFLGCFRATARLRSLKRILNRVELGISVGLLGRSGTCDGGYNECRHPGVSLDVTALAYKLCRVVQDKDAEVFTSAYPQYAKLFQRAVVQSSEEALRDALLGAQVNRQRAAAAVVIQRYWRRLKASMTDQAEHSNDFAASKRPWTKTDSVVPWKAFWWKARRARKAWEEQHVCVAPDSAFSLSFIDPTETHLHNFEVCLRAANIKAFGDVRALVRYLEDSDVLPELLGCSSVVTRISRLTAKGHLVVMEMSVRVKATDGLCYGDNANCDHAGMPVYSSMMCSKMARMIEGPHDIFGKHPRLQVLFEGFMDAAVIIQHHFRLWRSWRRKRVAAEQAHEQPNVQWIGEASTADLPWEVSSTSQ